MGASLPGDWCLVELGRYWVNPAHVSFVKPTRDGLQSIVAVAEEQFGVDLPVDEVMHRIRSVAAGVPA